MRRDFDSLKSFLKRQVGTALIHVIPDRTTDQLCSALTSGCRGQEGTRRRHGTWSMTAQRSSFSKNQRRSPLASTLQFPAGGPKMVRFRESLRSFAVCSLFRRRASLLMPIRANVFESRHMGRRILMRASSSARPTSMACTTTRRLVCVLSRSQPGKALRRSTHFRYCHTSKICSTSSLTSRALRKRMVVSSCFSEIQVVRSAEPGCHFGVGRLPCRSLLHRPPSPPPSGHHDPALADCRAGVVVADEGGVVLSSALTSVATSRSVGPPVYTNPRTSEL